MRRILKYTLAVILIVILSHAILIVSQTLNKIYFWSFVYQLLVFSMLFIFPIVILIISIKYFLGNLNLPGHIKSVLIPIAYIIMTLVIVEIENRLHLMQDVNLNVYSLFIILGTFIVLTLVSIINTFIYFSHKKKN
ncbi:MAG: hypothetical protein AABX07_05560 [Nanoarchaeota archaeon]